MTDRTNAAERRRATDAILQSSRSLVAIAARSMNELDDITLAQYRALVVLAADGPSASGQLAERLGVHPSTLTRLVDRLETRGLVSRSSTDDRREVLVGLTPPAVDILRSVTADRRRQLAAIIRRIPDDDLAAVVDAFVAFADATGEIPDDRWSIVLNPPFNVTLT